MSIYHCKRCQARLPRGDWFSNLCPDCVMAEVRRLEECYAETARIEAEHRAVAIASGLCPNCGDLAHVVDPCPAPDPDEERRAALDARGRP